MKILKTLLFIFIWGLTSFKGVRSQIVQEAKLVASNPISNGGLGGLKDGVSIYGSYAVVGRASSSLATGDILIYEKNNSCSNWTEIQRITSNPQLAGSFYGSSVAISQDFIVVGARGEDKDENNLNPLPSAGAVYIYQNINGVWTFLQKIVAQDREANARFGNSVDISGDKIIIGANRENGDVNLVNLSASGAAYIFEYNGTWSQTQKLVASDRAVNDDFGSSVSISNDYAVVGAQGEDENSAGLVTISGSGSAYVFEKNGLNWTQVNKLTSSDRGVSERFGADVSIDDNLIVVAARGDNQGVNGIGFTVNAGSAFVFRRDNTLGWIEEAKIVANDRAPQDIFGVSVSVSNESIVIGAANEDENALLGGTLTNSGSAYLFKYNGTSWNQNQKLVASDRGALDRFGNSVAIHNDEVIIGSIGEDNDDLGPPISGAGAAYIFTDTNNTSLTISKTVSNGPYFPGDQIVYTFTVENTGSSTVTDIVFEDIIPGNIIPSGFISLGISITGSTLTSAPFDLNSGDIRSFSFQGTINSNMICGVINNCASIIAADCVQNLPITDCENIYVASSNIPIPNGSADVTYCFGEPMADLTASLSSSLGSLHWYDGMTGPAPLYQGSTNFFSPIHTAPGVYNYLVSELVGSCLSAPDTITVTILPNDWQQVAGNTVNVDEQGEDVQVDDDENVYITGACGNNATFGSPSNPITINGPGFLAKYDRCGELLWVNGLPKAGKSIILDNSQATISVTGGGDQFGFLANYTINGSLNWANSFMSFIGNNVVGTSIDVDNADNIYVVGHYREVVTFNTQGGNSQTISAPGQPNGFLTKYSPNGQLNVVRNLISSSTSTFKGTLEPRGITVDGLGDFVYIGGSYSGNISLAGAQLNGIGEFVSRHETTNLNGINAVNVNSSFGWFDMAPLQELDWDRNREVVYAVGGRMIGSIAPNLTFPNWSTFGAPGERFFDIDYEEVSDRIYVSGFDDATREALVASVNVLGNGFNWRLTSTNTINQLGVDIARGVATNANTYSNGIINVYTTGEYAGDILFSSSTQSFANGVRKDIFTARVQDKNVLGVFHREKPVEGIVQQGETLDLAIYPNPFTEAFSIDLQEVDTEESVRIEVMDIRGKLIMKKENVKGGSLIDLNLSEMDKGIYLVSVTQKDKRVIKKMIKQ